MEHLNRLPTATEMRSMGGRRREQEGLDVGRREKKECSKEWDKEARQMYRQGIVKEKEVKEESERGGG